MRLYKHVTDGGAEYLCSSFVPSTADWKEPEGSFDSDYIVRLDYDDGEGPELSVRTDADDLLRRIVDIRELHPYERQVIDTDTVQEYEDATYRVTTIVPLCENPRKHVYRLTQEELDYYLDDYSMFAEFIVEIVRD